MRVAAVDLGTNTTRLLVADVADGRLEELHRESRITRLGENVDTRRRLLPAPVARVRNVLADYRRTLESLGAERTLAIATSAVREAENGEAFLGEVEWSYGFATRLLAGDDEALLTRRGVASGRELQAGTLVIDIGGGSTELILDDFHVSLELGSVRHTERFLVVRPADGGGVGSVRGRRPRRAREARPRCDARGGDGGGRGRGHGHDARRARPQARAVGPREASRATGSRRRARAGSWNGSPPCRSPNGATCRRSTRSARR